MDNKGNVWQMEGIEEVARVAAAAHAGKNNFIEIAFNSNGAVYIERVGDLFGLIEDDVTHSKSVKIKVKREKKLLISLVSPDPFAIHIPFNYVVEASGREFGIVGVDAIDFFCGEEIIGAI